MASDRVPEISKEDGVTVVALGEEFENLDEPGLDELREAILNVAGTADPPRLVVDLSHTNFFGSAFIEVLFRAWNRINSRDGGRFAISGLTRYCREVIETTHLDQLWDLYPHRDDAVSALKSS
ncbi:MAG: STAS domain-containing protein [Planctomycetaceae bacterium]